MSPARESHGIGTSGMSRQIRGGVLQSLPVGRKLERFANTHLAGLRRPDESQSSNPILPPAQP
jgi:hypothetical protein